MFVNPIFCIHFNIPASLWPGTDVFREKLERFEKRLNPNKNVSLKLLSCNDRYGMKTELEHILTGAYKEGMISFMATHPECFDEAVQLAIADKHPFSWRSAWLLSVCMEYNDIRIQKYLDKIIDVTLLKKDGHQRDLLRILFKMNLNDEQEGALFDICVTLWEAIGKIPSVRYTAFDFIVKTTKKYPDLINELAFLSQDHYLESLSPGIRNSVKRTIKTLSIKK